MVCVDHVVVNTGSVQEYSLVHHHQHDKTTDTFQLKILNNNTDVTIYICLYLLIFCFWMLLYCFIILSKFIAQLATESCTAYVQNVYIYIRSYGYYS